MLPLTQDVPRHRKRTQSNISHTSAKSSHKHDYHCYIDMFNENFGFIRKVCSICNKDKHVKVIHNRDLAAIRELYPDYPIIEDRKIKGDYV